MSSMQSGGATPEIKQNYSGGHIVFNAIHAWSEPLKEAGYNDNIKYVPPTGTEKRTKKPSRYPYIFWWNPPFNMKLKVEIKLRKKFLEIVHECFKKGTKLSYLCTSSLVTKIVQHTTKSTGQSQTKMQVAIAWRRLRLTVQYPVTAKPRMLRPKNYKLALNQLSH